MIVARNSMFFLVNLHLWCCSGKVDEKATQLHAIASLKVLLDATRPHNGAATSTAAHYSGASSRETTLQLQQGSQGTTTTTTTTTTTAGTTAGIQELPNGGIAAGLDAGLDSVIVKFDECLIASISSFRFLRPSSNSPKSVLFPFRSRARVLIDSLRMTREGGLTTAAADSRRVPCLCQVRADDDTRNAGETSDRVST